jgi:energy-coupling factor transporter ATP-binding protein EcfA2
MEADLPLIGLVKERRRPLEALRTRNSLLMLGPRGSGKTKLIQSAIRELPSRRDIIYVEYSSTLHELLISLARALLESGHHGIRKRTAAGPDVEVWLSRQTSVHLKGVLWNSLEADPRTIIFDGVDGSSHPIYRFLQRIYFAQGMGIFAASRDVLALGVLGRLFWDPRRTLQLQPLSQPDSNQLFHLAADRVGLKTRDLNLDEFREKVLDAAAGNPGQIVEMCRLAANPQYVRGRYIKFAPLRIDALMKFMG